MSQQVRVSGYQLQGGLCPVQGVGPGRGIPSLPRAVCFPVNPTAFVSGPRVYPQRLTPASAAEVNGARQREAPADIVSLEPSTSGPQQTARQELAEKLSLDLARQQE